MLDWNRSELLTPGIELLLEDSAPCDSADARRKGSRLVTLYVIPPYISFTSFEVSLVLVDVLVTVRKTLLLKT